MLMILSLLTRLGKFLSAAARRACTSYAIIAAARNNDLGNGQSTASPSPTGDNFDRPVDATNYTDRMAGGLAPAVPIIVGARVMIRYAASIAFRFYFAYSKNYIQSKLGPGLLHS
jgi:hypothetical protein